MDITIGNFEQDHIALVRQKDSLAFMDTPMESIKLN